MGIVVVNLCMLHFFWSFGFINCGEWVCGEVFGGEAVSDETSFEL